MTEKEILILLGQISEKLDKGQTHINKSEWEAVGTLFSEINTIQEQIKKNDPSIETLLSQSPGFKAAYEPLKESLLKKTASTISAIETWKASQTEKISGSKNVLDNLSKYYNPSKKSYYIDTKE